MTNLHTQHSIGNIYTQTYNTDEFQFVKLENLSGAF